MIIHTRASDVTISVLTEASTGMLRIADIDSKIIYSGNFASYLDIYKYLDELVSRGIIIDYTK